MTEPTFDSNGYPTQETLQTIVGWPFLERGAHGLLDFCRRAWKWDDYFGEYEMSEDGHIHIAIATGGWSGNEDIIGALMENNLFWLMCWESSRRGGYYTFDIAAKLWEKPLDKGDGPITLGPVGQRTENAQVAWILREMAKALDKGDIVAGRTMFEHDLDDVTSSLETVYAWRDSGRRTMTFYYWQHQKEQS